MYVAWPNDFIKKEKERIESLSAATSLKAMYSMTFLKRETSLLFFKYIIKDYYLTVHYPVTALVAGEVWLQNTGLTFRWKIDWVNGQMLSFFYESPHAWQTFSWERNICELFTLFRSGSIWQNIHCTIKLLFHIFISFLSFPAQVAIALQIHWFEQINIFKLRENITITSYVYCLYVIAHVFEAMIRKRRTMVYEWRIG